MQSFKNTASRRKGHRWHMSVILPALCVLLMGGVILSTIMLGESLGRVTPRQTNIIFLVPPDSSHAIACSTETEYSNAASAANPEEDPSAVLAEREVRVYQDRLPTYANSGKKLKTISEAMAEHYKIRSSAPNQSGIVYNGIFEVTDDKQKWDSETRVDLFKSSYSSVESSQGDKLIAPGTSNYYDFTLENNGNVPFDYEISIEVNAFPYENEAVSKLPLEWRLVGEDGADVSGWQTYTNSTGILSAGTLDTFRKQDYTIEWRWQFERGDDEYDTYIGNLSAQSPVEVDATIYVRSEQSAGWTPPEPPKPDEPDTPPEDLKDPDLIQANDEELIPVGSEEQSRPHEQAQGRPQPQSASRIEDSTDGAHRTVYIVILAVSLAGLAIIFIFAAAKRKHSEENTDEQS